MSNGNQQKSSGRLWGIIGLGVGIGACIVFFIIAINVYFLLDKQDISLPYIDTATVAVVQEDAEVESQMTTEAMVQTAVAGTLVPRATAVSTATAVSIPPTVAQAAVATPSLEGATVVVTETPPPVAGTTAVDTTAVSTQSATIFPAPHNSGTAGRPYVATGGQVDVIGRDASGSWLYVEDKDGNEGYVWGAFFTYGGQISQLPVITPVPPTATATLAVPTPAITATATITNAEPPSAATIAYWQEMDGTKRDIGGGRWAVDLLVFVPSGGSYAFAVNGDLEVTAVFSTIASPHAGYDSYVVTISGMGCAGALANDFYVRRDGQVLEVRNEYTDETGALYVDALGC